MARIVRLTEDIQLEKSLKEFEENSYYNEKVKGRRKEIFKQFVERMKLVELKKTVYATNREQCVMGSSPHPSTQKNNPVPNTGITVAANAIQYPTAIRFFMLYRNNKNCAT